ncbi:hypothetical protein J6TS2_10750 [Heyndrickxia sporothermodurans]|nr:hypothetical protein J6TS2_10750 [Heyndrickxia sporothermodurans]
MNKISHINQHIETLLNLIDGSYMPHLLRILKTHLRNLKILLGLLQISIIGHFNSTLIFEKAL